MDNIVESGRQAAGRARAVLLAMAEQVERAETALLAIPAAPTGQPDPEALQAYQRALVDGIFDAMTAIETVNHDGYRFRRNCKTVSGLLRRATEQNAMDSRAASE